jgi:hypothetical protein
MSNARRTAVYAALWVAAVALPAAAEPQPVRGSQFVTMMQGNTLSGTTPTGDEFNMYFLAGGIATYEDTGGARDSGSWRIDNEGDVCVAWQFHVDKQEGCFLLTVDGSKVAWEGKLGATQTKLRGGITETFLKGAVQ